MGDIIWRAKNLAKKLHNGQKRDSGKPYTWHTNKVAQILGLVTTDDDVIAAGYLHDVLEDCKITEAELRAIMGSKVANLVVEVTKEGENCFPLLMSRDAFLIKFADRLQNLSDMVTWTDTQMKAYMAKSVFWKTEVL